MVRHLLRDGGRRRNDADLNAFLPDDVLHVGNRRDDDASDVLSDNPVVDVEQAGRTESQASEGLIVSQGPAQMADAGNADFPMLLQPDDFHDLLTQLADVIPYAFLSKRAETRQILADLFRRNAQPFT